MTILKTRKSYFLIPASATFLVYLPIIFNPTVLLNRGNDLQEFFWPITYFVKQQIFQNRTLLLWNNLFFSGTPLLPDPQSPLFYLPNLIFLLLPIDTAFITSLIFHTLLGGGSMYLTAGLVLGSQEKQAFLPPPYGLPHLGLPEPLGKYIFSRYKKDGSCVINQTCVNYYTKPNS